MTATGIMPVRYLASASDVEKHAIAATSMTIAEAGVDRRCKGRFGAHVRTTFHASGAARSRASVHALRAMAVPCAVT